MPSAEPAITKTYFFGSLVKYQDPERYTSSLRLNLKRLALVVGVLLMLVYGLGATAGYVWLHQARKIHGVTFWQVMLFRGKAIRREIAAQQLAKAKEALDAKDYRSAYLSVNSSLRNDPDNVEARLMASGFLQASGSVDHAIGLLEQGLQRTPGERALIQQTFDLLASTSHYRRALELLHGQMASQFSGPNGNLLRIYELSAMLGADGPAAARRLLDQHPELRKDSDACGAVARVLWEAGEHSETITLLSDYIRTHPDAFGGYVQLTDYQQASGMLAEARQTAEQACAHFSDEPVARIMLIGTYDPGRADEVVLWQKEVVFFLGKYGSKPKAVALLADLAGRKGWAGLARSLYEMTMSRRQDARMLALYFSDALVLNKQFEEARRLLAEMDLQAQDAPELSLLIWPRQVVVAAAGGAREDAREIARHLAATLQRDPERIEFYRRRFVQLGIPEAAAEFTATVPAKKNSAPKKT